MNQDWIGYTAATLTTCSFVPQVWQTWRSKNASSISLLMYSVLITGSSLWLVYGLLLGAWPLVVANAVTLSLVIMIWFMKLRYR